MAEKKNEIICPLCGVNKIKYQGRKIKGREHIPPKCIFVNTKDYQDDLITVPACKDCNNGTSSNDQLFMKNLSIYLGIGTEERRQLHNKLRKTIHRDKKLKKTFWNDTDMNILVPSPTKEYDYGYRHYIDFKVIELAITKITKGLYYLLYGQGSFIAPDAEINIYIMEQGKKFDHEVFNLLKPYLKTINKMGNQFEAMHAHVPKRNDASCWFYKFYGEECFVAIVTPTNKV